MSSALLKQYAAIFGLNFGRNEIAHLFEGPIFLRFDYCSVCWHLSLFYRPGVRGGNRRFHEYPSQLDGTSDRSWSVEIPGEIGTSVISNVKIRHVFGFISLTEKRHVLSIAQWLHPSLEPLPLGKSGLFCF